MVNKGSNFPDFVRSSRFCETIYILTHALNNLY